MAVWQYDLSLIPGAAVTPEAQAQNPEFPYGDAWKHHPDPDTVEVAISSMMPTEPNEWDRTTLRVGHENATYVEFFHDNDRLVEVGVRFDLREPACSFVPIAVHLCIVAEEQELVFVDLDRRGIFEPTLDRLMNHIAASDAAEYCRNPKAWRDKKHQQSDTKKSPPGS